jgi:hypothetical protein
MKAVSFFKFVLPLVLIAGSLSGCSVILAGSSPSEPDLTRIQIGAARTTVEDELGKPIKFLRQSHGDVAVYTFLGEDKVDYKRAALYLAADVITLFLAELVTAPIETLQNDQHVLEVSYFRDQVRSVDHTVKGAPLESPRRMLNIE